MSGSSYESECPKCGGSMNSYMDWKPYDTVSHNCLECGFYAYTAEDRLGLEEVNEQRADQDMKPIDKLTEYDDMAPSIPITNIPKE